MNPLPALLVCILGIFALFFLDRDKSIRTSKAFWLPVIWLWIVGSRPASAWLGVQSAVIDRAQVLEGSPTDRLVFEILLGIGIIVLIFRSSRTSALLKENWVILSYFSYCLLSITWSDFPGVAFKRWTKAIGDLVMVLIVLTETDVAAALKRLFARVGFILLPFSVLLIRYFGELGRGYDPDGNPMNTGVTTNKNSLGVITFVITLGALWNVLALLRTKEEPHRSRRLLAQGALLITGGALLAMAHSATSSACFALGAVLILATNQPVIRRRPWTLHAIVLTIVLGCALTMLLSGRAVVLHAMGRETNLTGRADIWNAVIPVAPNAAVGAGFESFWLGPRLDQVWARLPSVYMHVDEAHNGYLEVYLNLGLVGVSFIALILFTGYRRAVATFRRNPALGSLMLAYVATAAIYGITEASFRLLCPAWIFLVFAVVAFGRDSRAVGAHQEVGAIASNAARLSPTLHAARLRKTAQSFIRTAASTQYLQSPVRRCPDHT